jgi:predicted ATP-dependent serine protease
MVYSVAAESVTEQVLGMETAPSLLVVDSIQTMTSYSLPESTPGSVSMVSGLKGSHIACILCC